MVTNGSDSAYNNETFSETDFPEFAISKKLWIYLSPVVILLGTLSNILAILVLIRKTMRSSQTMFYLCVLAFADISVLYTGLLRQWIISTFDIDIRNLSEFSCKFGLFIVYFTLDFSVWILTAGTIDRCISVCLPLKSRRFQGLRNARISICVCACVLVALNCHFFWTVELTTKNDQPRCSELQQNIEFSYNMWPWINFCFSCAIPFVIMIICNILIIRQIIVSRNLIQVLTGSSRKNHSTYSNSSRASSKSRNTNNFSKAQSITVMLLTVNFIFLLLTSPSRIVIIGYKYWHNEDHPYGKDNALLQLFWPIVNLMMYTNNAINLFLYCLTGPRFRRELFAVLKCSRNHQHSWTITGSSRSTSTSGRMTISTETVTRSVSP